MKYQLIIFDLDDTLIDTWNCFLPVELKGALLAMIQEGLVVEDVEKAFTLLMEINGKSPDGTSAIRKFLQKIGADERFLDVAIQSYYHCSHSDFKITPLPGVVETLPVLKKRYALALVSRGIERIQRLKVDKAGIDAKLFSDVIVTLNYDKGDAYQKLLLKQKCLPREALVVGDKYDSDLLPAKKLGMATVFMNHGRGKVFPPKKGEVDFMIHRLEELLVIVREKKL